MLNLLQQQQIIVGGGRGVIFTIQSPNRWQIPVSGFVARIERLRHICHKQHSQPFLSEPLFPSHCFHTNRFPLEIQELCLHIIQPSAFPGPKAWHWSEQLCVSSWFGKTKFTLARLSCTGGQKEHGQSSKSSYRYYYFLVFPSNSQENLCGPDWGPLKVPFSQFYRALHGGENKQGGVFMTWILGWIKEGRCSMWGTRVDVPAKAPAKSTGDKGPAISSSTIPWLNQNLFSLSRSAFSTGQEFQSHSHACVAREGKALAQKEKKSQPIRDCACRFFVLHICIFKSLVIFFFFLLKASIDVLCR